MAILTFDKVDFRAKKKKIPRDREGHNDTSISTPERHNPKYILNK